jgi:hypothetical protein
MKRLQTILDKLRTNKSVITHQVERDSKFRNVRSWYSDWITGLKNGDRSSIPSRDKTYSYAPKSAYRLSGPTQLLFNRNRRASSRKVEVPGHKADQSSHLLQKLWISGVVHPIPPFVFMTHADTNLIWTTEIPSCLINYQYNYAQYDPTQLQYDQTQHFIV